MKNTALRHPCTMIVLKLDCMSFSHWLEGHCMHMMCAYKDMKLLHFLIKERFTVWNALEHGHLHDIMQHYQEITTLSVLSIHIAKQKVSNLLTLLYFTINTEHCKTQNFTHITTTVSKKSFEWKALTPQYVPV